MKTENYDVVIVWWGPAWVTTACILKKHLPETKVLIIEKETFPRHKIGESILPGAIDVIKAIGCLDKIEEQNFLKKMWAYYFWWKSREEGFLLPSNKLECKDGKYTDLTPHILTYHVDRAKYDLVLLNHAKDMWVDVIESHKVNEIHWNDDEITQIDVSNDTSYTAKYFVDATGIYNGFIPRSKKDVVPMGSYFWNVAYFGYLKDAKFIQEFPGLDNYIATTVTAHGNYTWSWYIPIEKDIVSVGFVFNTKYNPQFLDYDREELLITKLQENQKIKDAISGAHLIEHCGLPKINTIKNWNGYSKNTSGKNWFLVWDAAFFSDPILSTWVTMSQRTGYYLWIVLKEMLHTQNDKLSELLIKEYKESCMDFYSQVKGIIQFWYEGMDGDYKIHDLFEKGDDAMKNFGMLNSKWFEHSFVYIVNGLLQSIDDGDNAIINGSYDQDDYERMIRWIAGVDVSIDDNKAEDGDVFVPDLRYMVKKAIKLCENDITLGYKIYIDNEYKSKFFVSGSINNFLILIDGVKTVAEIVEHIGMPEDSVDIFKKELLKLEILWAIKKL